MSRSLSHCLYPVSSHLFIKQILLEEKIKNIGASIVFVIIIISQLVVSQVISSYFLFFIFFKKG